jgi:hypothetical protein
MLIFLNFLSFILSIRTGHNLGCYLKASNSIEDVLKTHGLSEQVQSKISSKLKSSGIENVEELILLATDFIERPEIFSDLLQSDFSFDALSAHRLRAVVMNILSKQSHAETRGNERTVSYVTSRDIQERYDVEDQKKEKGVDNFTSDLPLANNSDILQEKPIFKKVIVNLKAQSRKQNILYVEYGLPKDYDHHYPIIASEIDDFLEFMTRPTTKSQEPPIRRATADVYVRHTKQFIGWWIRDRMGDDINRENLSINYIIPNKEKSSADVILDFIVWLRSTRAISVSYEANLLRGLIKLIKFRFSSESKSDPRYGEKSFDDIPIIRELRKLHRDANKRQSVAPRSSDESAKWLTWLEYLSVVQSLESEVTQMIRIYDAETPSSSSVIKSRKIAIAYQHYLVLAFFASVPDRQRTIS